MKKTTAILLFFALTFPFWGSFVALHIQKEALQREIKWSIAEGLPKSQLTQLSFQSDEIDSLVNWKHSKEFEYEGEMFDIVQTEITGDSTHFWCWWDKEETLLNKRIDKLAYVALSGDEKTHKQQEHFLMFVKLLNLPPKNVTSAASSELGVTHETSGEFNILTNNSVPDTPPPKC
ncbi:hypothetical protein [Halocola ammonii]